MKYSLILFTLFSTLTFSQDLALYNVQWHQPYRTDSVRSFISISDAYHYSEHPDSLSIPEKYTGYKAVVDEYILIEGQYRERCLNTVNILESDKIFIYDFVIDKMVEFTVRDLSLFGFFNPYSSSKNTEVYQFDYLIGFMVENEKLKESKQYYENILISIGKRNPFQTGKIKPIKWTEIDSVNFPINANIDTTSNRLNNRNVEKVFKFLTGQMTYYVRNLMVSGNLIARHVVVVKTNSINILFEELYFDSEGASPSPLNTNNSKYGPEIYQFTGELIKGKPPVIFGFLFQSFGCPSVNFIDSSNERIYIKCDNRH